MITTDVGNDYSALGLAGAPKADTSKELGAEDFLKLMLTQFQNQDPLKPLDNGDFIGQLAQFGTVTGLTQLRQDFGSLAGSLVSNQALQASSLLGRDVLVNQPVAALADGGSVSGAVELASVRLTQTTQACPEPKQRTLSLGLLKLAGVSYEGTRLQSRPVTTSLASGTISTNLTATLEHGTHLQLSDLTIKSVPVEKVLVDFLCEGYAVTGPLDLTGALSTNTANLMNTLNGSGHLRIGQGKVVGPQALALVAVVTRVAGVASSVLAADVPSSLTSSPVDFESITGNYQITNGVLSTKDLLYTTKALKVGVAGDYGLVTGKMNLDMRVDHGRGEVRAKVTGNASSPSVRVDPASIAGQVDREKVESGVQELLKRFRR